MFNGPISVGGIAIRETHRCYSVIIPQGSHSSGTSFNVTLKVGHAWALATVLICLKFIELKKKS